MMCLESDLGDIPVWEFQAEGPWKARSSVRAVSQHTQKLRPDSQRKWDDVQNNSVLFHGC